MEFHVDCFLAYQVVESASFLFNVAAVNNSLQRVIKEDLNITGTRPAEELVDGGQRLHRVVAGSGRVELSYHAMISVEPELLDPSKLGVAPLHELPQQALVFLYPSRFCQSDLLMRFANREFTNIESGFERLTRISNWIYEYVEYFHGTTNSSTSAFDTATQRAGVCRDFAHLGIALCRALGIPARFVSGYAYGLNPPDFHAYFEAFLGGRWIIADPTRLSPQSSFVKIGGGGTQPTRHLPRFLAMRRYKKCSYRCNQQIWSLRRRSTSTDRFLTARSDVLPSNQNVDGASASRDDELLFSNH